MSARVLEADCIEALRELDEASVDAIVCDPPYGLEFMGKDWDRFAPEAPTRRSGWDQAQAGAKLAGDPSTPHGRPAFGKRRGTYRCSGCGKRDAFRNEHGCDGEWVHEWVDPQPLEALSFQEWSRLWAVEALRVLKPGGHLLAFGGTRTHHRLACAIEDAGFEIRDCIAWMYGSGFPKSLDVSKAIDKAAGAEREVVGVHGDPATSLGNERTMDGGAAQENVLLTAPATPEARRWQGWGTALKPAYEPIVVARKPLAGTVAENVLEHGTGALNIDGCRIPGEPVPINKLEAWSGFGQKECPDYVATTNTQGRWPANVALDPEAAAMLDKQSGERPGGNYPAQRGAGVATGFGAGRPTEGGARAMGDTGGASRFYYCAKASKGEREAGLEAFPAVERVNGNKWTDEDYRVKSGERPPSAESGPRRNVHPTVKPIALMRWLVRLVTPPGGTVLDPFTGSGTTGCAAVLEGFDFIGIEREPDYAAIARARIEFWAQFPGQDVEAVLHSEQQAKAQRETGQGSLLEEAA